MHRPSLQPVTAARPSVRSTATPMVFLAAEEYTGPAASDGISVALEVTKAITSGPGAAATRRTSTMKGTMRARKRSIRRQGRALLATVLSGTRLPAATRDYMTACQGTIGDDLDQSVEDAVKSQTCCSAAKRFVR